MERTWIVVCDASHCRLFMKRLNDHEWVKFETIENPAGRAKGIDLLSDRAGRSLQSQGPNKKSAMDPHTPPRDVEEMRFSHKIADLLDAAYRQNAFERLILVAPPQFLGLLRDALHGQVQKAIYGTIDKDYTHLSDHEVADRVATPQ
jgi:protein required for attachment to host cells